VPKSMPTMRSFSSLARLPVFKSMGIIAKTINVFLLSEIILAKIG
jgi:hypothetical protein